MLAHASVCACLQHKVSRAGAQDFVWRCAVTVVGVVAADAPHFSQLTHVVGDDACGAVPHCPGTLIGIVNLLFLLSALPVGGCFWHVHSSPCILFTSSFVSFLST